MPEFLQWAPLQYGLALIAVLLALALAWRLAANRTRNAYMATPSLLPAEDREFLTTLEQAVGDDYRVYPRIPLVELFEVRESLGRRARQHAEAELEDRCADFVLCTPQQFVVVAIIALDETVDRSLRQLCRDCGLALIPFRASEAQSAEAVQNKIMSALAAPNAPGMGTTEAGTRSAGESAAPELSGSPDAAGETRLCPDCGTAMVQTETHWYCPRCIIGAPD